MATRLAPSKRPNGGDIADAADDGFFAPPVRWASDPRPLFPVVASAAVPAPTTAAVAAAGPSQAPPPPFLATAEDAERAWRHARRAGGVGGSIGGSLTSPSSSLSASGTSSSDGLLQAPVDLYDALVHSSRETQYTLQPPGVRRSKDGGERKKKNDGITILDRYKIAHPPSTSSMPPRKKNNQNNNSGPPSSARPRPSPPPRSLPS